QQREAYPQQHDQDGGAESDQPVREGTLAESHQEVSEQGHGTGMRVCAMRVRPQSAITDYPDQEWHEGDAGQQAHAQDEQLAGQRAQMSKGSVDGQQQKTP